MKYLGLWSPNLQTFYEKFVKPSGPPLPTYLIYAPLTIYHLKLSHVYQTKFSDIVFLFVS